MILNYLKNLPYIKEVIEFSLAHFYFDEATDDDGIKARVNYTYKDDVYIKGSLPLSVLIPSARHLITVKDIYNGDNDKKIGISEFAIMDELLVDEDDGADVIVDVDAGTDEPPIDEGLGDGNNFFDLLISHNLD